MNKKQIEKSTNELVVLIRQYIIGFQKPVMVKNKLNCLFVDILLDKDTQDIIDRMDAKGYSNTNLGFNNLLKEMCDGI